MSMLSKWYEKRFKRKVRAWLVAEGVGYVMGIALFRAWLDKQPQEVRDAAPELLRRAFSFIADKWF